MTVAELRKALEGLPDGMLVVYPYDSRFNIASEPAVISVAKSDGSYGDFSRSDEHDVATITVLTLGED